VGPLSGNGASARPLRVAVDIGGTFVDAVEFDEETGVVRLHKEPTTPEHPAEGVLSALRGLGADLGSISTFIHGTTLGLNSILERRGAPTGLITNDGFRDIFEVARGDVPPPKMYDFQYERPPLIVPRRCALGVPGRIDYSGSVVEDLDEDAVREAARLLVEEHGVRSVVVAFLHAYANPEHERRAAAVMRAAFPDLSISVSSDIAREYREYERTSTAVLDAYIRPIFERYVGELENGLDAEGFRGSFLITRSGGGAMASSVAKQAPLLTVLSGPAGGIIGASAVASLVERPNLISFDVGGTSLDACVILDAQPTEVYEARIEHLPLLIPIFDIRTIGAGGGSIAWLDDGLLKVGPQSAGAQPGPICYGRGGTEPTVTDAAIVLGYLTAEEFLGGQLTIDEEAARGGIAERIAAPLGLELVPAAAGILRVMLARTVGAIREITVERGMDPREFSLLAFGGAGPMLAPMLMSEMDILEVIVPQAPAGFSAWGMLMSDLEFDFARTVLTILGQEAVDALTGQYRELESLAEGVLAEQAVEEADRTLQHRLDLRYLGQEHTLAVSVDGIASADEIRRRFEEAHRERYGHSLDARVQILNLRLRAIGRTAKPELEPLQPDTQCGTSLVGTREAYDFAADSLTEFAVRDRKRLNPGDRVRGPSIVVEGTCTVIVSSDQALTVDPYGHLIVRRVDA
jgi:N-methylhydantoinase A/oxoprolinase/acetone carboxylase beta subunit